ncbi:MAG TPA: VWA domain-containing protein [Thermoanaerobaculia bacterium]|jgi:VWFA-related protein|nr:VWA domain-containing protein [Thermoanaerobaculia bacterium]
MNQPRAWLLVPIACVAAIAAAPGPGPTQSPPRFGEAVDVELVNVEVWVTDRQGRPVTGLAASDFELRQDGDPVAITNFSEIRGAALTTVATAVEAPAPATVPAPPAERPADVPVSLVLYFDQLHLQPRDYPPLLDGVAKLLVAGAVPAERVMVLRQDRQLHLEVPLGSSRQTLDAALGRLAATRNIGDSAETEQIVAAVSQAWQESEDLGGVRARIASAGAGAAVAGGPRAAVGGDTSGVTANASGSGTCDLFVGRITPTVSSWAHEHDERTSVTLRHLQRTGSILAGLPGVKTLVYMSDALETQPASPLVAAVGALCPGQHIDSPQEEMSRELLALTRHLNTNQVTIYAMQASGLRVADSITAGSRGAAGGSLGARVTGTFESAHRTSQRSGMGTLADETGGRLVINQNDFGIVLQTIGQEIQSYYSLAYRPPRAGAGEHRIAVSLEDRSLTARYRRGYREKDGEERMRELLESALYLGITANPLDVRLGAGAIRPRGERHVLPLHIFVPVEGLAFVGPQDAQAAELRVQVLARNVVNPRTAWLTKGFRVRRPAGASGQADLTVEVELDAGTNVVAVGLRDEGSRATSLVSTTVEIAR